VSERPTKIANNIDIQAIGALDRRVPEPQGLLAEGIQAAGETAKAQLFARIQTMGRANRRVPAPTGKAARHFAENHGKATDETDGPSIFKL
jgi:hypothetical protein